MNLAIITISLYAVGAFLYYISNGWFRKTLISLAALFGVFYILILLATANPSPGAGIGLAYIVMFGSLPGLPATGILFGFLGDKLASFSKDKYSALSLRLLCLALFPLLLLYLFKIGPDKKYANIHNHHFKGHYAIQFNGAYLDLPCRREFHRFRPVKDCSLQKPLVRTDFQKVHTLNITPNGHGDRNDRCEPEAPKRDEIARFCDLKLLPYNVDFLFEKSKIKRWVRNHKRRGNTPDNQNNLEKTIGNLKVLQETTKTHSNGHPTSIDYHFQLDRSSTTAFLHCYNAYSRDRAIFKCTMKINYADKIWASALRFEAPLEQIENEADQIISEVADYYSYLIETYGVPA